MPKLPHPVVYEHEDFYVLYKPAGHSFHQESEETGFFAAIQAELAQAVWPVHRLDKLTSGLVLMARSAAAAEQFRQLFSEQAVQKCYLALSAKKPSKKQGWIKGDMSKARGGSYKLLRSTKNPAITRFFSYSLAPNLRLFSLLPKTGKTHQLRVAMKSISSPIIGDIRYGGVPADRGYLHAYRLKFCWQGQRIDINTLPRSGELFLRHADAIANLMTDSDPFRQQKVGQSHQANDKGDQ